MAVLSLVFSLGFFASLLMILGPGTRLEEAHGRTRPHLGAFLTTRSGTRLLMRKEPSLPEEIITVKSALGEE